MFLTDHETATLTGYQRSADQRRWLRERGWVFEVSAAGKPVVSRAYAERRMGMVQQETLPDFSAWGKAA